VTKQDLTEYTKSLNILKGRKIAIEKDIELFSNNLIQATEEKDTLNKAFALVKFVATEAQSKLEYRIKYLCNMALSSIWNNPPELEVKFEERRGQIECDLLFDKKTEPENIVGGGILDILSFSLRIAAWTLKKTSNTIILDEPFKFLSPSMHIKAGELVKTLSQRLGIQFIIVSHSDTVNESADKVFDISIENRKSIVN
jgi:DNA repair exonuclease SbcCD ATPase subunit